MSPKTLKISASFILLAAAAAFAAESCGYDVLDNYKSISHYDSHAWTTVLITLSVAQMWLLRCAHGCLKCRVWSDFILQISGLVLLIIGLAFIAVFPPFSWFMGVFPILGVVFIVAGRSFSKQSRRLLRGKDE